MKTLECSSKGDKRFSAFYARVKMWGREASIEEHYQLAKRFGDVAPKTIKEAKGKRVTHIHLNGKDYDAHFLTPFYKLLWYRYLELNPELVEYASQFDNFTDMFKGKSLNCQADVIAQYIKEGKESVWNDCLELWTLFTQKKENTSPPKKTMKTLTGNVFDYFDTGEYDAVVITTNGIIKANGRAVMGKGIALAAVERFAGLDFKLAGNLKRYGNRTFLYKYPEGHVITAPTKQHWQDKSPIELVEKSIIELVEIADKFNLQNILVPPMGCGNGGLKLSQVLPLMERYFDDRFSLITNK